MARMLIMLRSDKKPHGEQKGKVFALEMNGHRNPIGRSDQRSTNVHYRSEVSTQR